MNKDYTKLFNDKFDAALQAERFPVEKIIDGFHSWLSTALLHQTEFTLQCSWVTFKGLLEAAILLPVKPVGFSMLEMCNAINAIEFSTPTQLGVNLKMYSDIKDAVKQMAAAWDELSAPIRQQCNEEVQKEYDEDMKAQQAKNSILPAGGAPLPRKTLAFPNGKK